MGKGYTKTCTGVTLDRERSSQGWLHIFTGSWNEYHEFSVEVIRKTATRYIYKGKHMYMLACALHKDIY